MAEEVNTGGLHRFVRRKGEEPKLSEEQRRGFQEAYARADERKAREKRNKIVLWIVIVLVILGAIGFLLLR